MTRRCGYRPPSLCATRRSHLRFLYLVVSRMLSLIVLVSRRRESKEIEILVLRHELEILRRQSHDLVTSRPIGPGSPR